MTTIAVYPGSFDPVTLGHLSVLGRAAKLFSKVHVLVVHNPDKKTTFSLSQREALLREAIQEAALTGNIEVSVLESGLLANRVHELGSNAIVKGFRTPGDIEYEIPMAQVNRDLSQVETVFLASEPGFGYVSSSLVRQVASLGGDVSSYVTPGVAQALRVKFSE